MIRIKYMWSYYEGSVLVEGICECEAAPAFIAQLFNDPHLTFIQANGGPLRPRVWPGVV